MIKTLKRNKKVLIIVVVVLLLAAAFAGGSYLLRVNRYQKTVLGLTYSDVDISSIPNGTYVGECDVDFVKAKVRVVVADGAISEITILEHKQERGASAERIVDTIVDQQRIDVDAITSATNSSKVLKKAVENALTQPLK